MQPRRPVVPGLYAHEDAIPALDSQSCVSLKPQQFPGPQFQSIGADAVEVNTAGGESASGPVERQAPSAAIVLQATYGV